MQEEIIVKGAKENNLKNVTVKIPRNKLTVLTGLSGSGKSTLAFDTIFAEGFGRCDLYGGDMSALKQSIKRLTEMAKSESRWIYPGHGESSTLRQATENLKYYF